jgi:hypothetical protein
MCNCGNKRNIYTEQSYKLSNEVAADVPVKKMWADSKYEYTGQTGLTVTGGVTGRRYRFTHHGDVQVIDYRDAGGMKGVPVLRRVKG